jgi:hypothetical protein
MDPVDVIQLVFAGTTALVLGRIGLALARYVERRLSGIQDATHGADNRLRAVEDECTLLRQELSELQERQEFTERALLQDGDRQPLRSAGSDEKRVVTPR